VGQSVDVGGGCGYNTGGTHCGQGRLQTRAFISISGTSESLPWRESGGNSRSVSKLILTQKGQRGGNALLTLPAPAGKSNIQMRVGEGSQKARPRETVISSLGTELTLSESSPRRIRERGM